MILLIIMILIKQEYKNVNYKKNINIKNYLKNIKLKLI